MDAPDTRPNEAASGPAGQVGQVGQVGRVGRVGRAGGTTSRPVIDRRAKAAHYVVGATWLSLPFVCGPTVGAALSTRSGIAQQVVPMLLWAAWAAGVLCLLLPRTLSLTVLRVLTPGAPVATLAALVSGANDAAPGREVSAPVAALGLALATVAALVSLTSWLGHAFVNGSSYGDERRFALRPSGALLFGPLELAWAALVGVPAAAVSFLATERWVAAAATGALSVPIAIAVARAFHGLSRRWLVFVPAGIVVHDYSTLTDSVLVQRRMVASIAPASDPPVAHLDGAPPLDLTGGASGLAIQIDFTEPVTVVPRPKARPGTGAVAESVEVAALLVAPSRPGAVIAHASARYHLGA